MEENLKKALCEMMVLALLQGRDYYAPEMAEAIACYSGGVISVTFPYAILYRMMEQGYIEEKPKRAAPDGRRRQYYGITEEGRVYYQQIHGVYRAFIAGVDRLVERAVSPQEQFLPSQKKEKPAQPHMA